MYQSAYEEISLVSRKTEHNSTGSSTNNSGGGRSWIQRFSALQLQTV